MSNGIDEAVSRLNSTFAMARELRELPGMLRDGERVVELAGGRFGKGMGLLALTSQRLVFVFSGPITRQSHDFPLTQLTSVNWQSGLMFGQIVITVAGAANVIDKVERRDGRRLVDAARSAEHTQPSVTVVQPGPSDAAAALRTLASLRDSGAITETEFYDKKKELLARI
jgi:hypothetical protein